MCVKPLIQSSSEAPFTCCGLPTSHHLSARCYPWQATPLHHRWRLHISLYNSSIAEMSRDTGSEHCVYQIFAGGRSRAKRWPVRRDPIMQMNKLIRPPVGPDVSRPPPIYRPSPDVPI